MTEVTAKDGTKWFCSKGMVDVILKTNPDDEGKQWTMNNYDEMSKQAHKADADLGIAGGMFLSPERSAGYKTLGVAVSKNGGPMEFAGILPIMDPPRHDTKETIRKIKESQVAVKMITGSGARLLACVCSRRRSPQHWKGAGTADRSGHGHPYPRLSAASKRGT